MEKALFGAGCFWGVEDFFHQVPGVIDAVSGYAGGTTDNPTYKQVCNDETYHAEVVEVTFDPSKVTYAQLVTAWTKGRTKGAVVYAQTDEQKQIAVSQALRVANAVPFQRE